MPLHLRVTFLLVISDSTPQNQKKGTAKKHLSLEILLSCLHQPVTPFSTNKEQKNLSLLFKIPCFYQVQGCGFLTGKETNENI